MCIKRERLGEEKMGGRERERGVYFLCVCGGGGVEGEGGRRHHWLIMETDLSTFVLLLYNTMYRIKQVVSEVVSAAVQKEVGVAVQEQVARMSPEVRQEEERRKKQVS